MAYRIRYKRYARSRRFDARDRRYDERDRRYDERDRRSDERENEFGPRNIDDIIDGI